MDIHDAPSGEKNNVFKSAVLLYFLSFLKKNLNNNGQDFVLLCLMCPPSSSRWNLRPRGSIFFFFLFSRANQKRVKYRACCSKCWMWQGDEVRGSSYWKWWWGGNVRLSHEGQDLPHQPFSVTHTQIKSWYQYTHQLPMTLKLNSQRACSLLLYITETGNQSALLFTYTPTISLSCSSSSSGDNSKRNFINTHINLQFGPSYTVWIIEMCCIANWFTGCWR